jgi:hypothetical protein
MSVSIDPISLVPSSPAYGLAIDLVIISILLSGFALGISRALRSKKLWAFGVEELSQAIINAAMLGVLITFTMVCTELVNSFVSDSMIDGCPTYVDYTNSAISYSLCSIDNAIFMGQNISASLAENSFKLGFLSTINLNLNVVSVQPFSSLANPSSDYSDWVFRIADMNSILEVQRQFLFFIAGSAFSIFLPIGLLFRMFFATRKLGGVIMAISIGLYLLYPLAYISLIQADNLSAIYEQTKTNLDSLLDALAFSPLIDWDKPGELANETIKLTGNNISQAVFMPYSSVSAFLGALSHFALIYPIIALAITLVFIFELSTLLGSEFSLDLMEMI